MRKNPTNPDSQSGLFNRRVLLAFTLCSVGVFLAALGLAAMPTLAGWSLITSPNTSTTQDNDLNAVTCVSASDCWAVGHYYGSALQTLTEHWDGTSWTIVPSPNASTTHHNDLSAVTCASTSDCWAVGYYIYYYNSLPYPTPYSQTLIEHWDGNSWSVVVSPNTSATQNNDLSAVACSSASECWAVGSYVPGSNGQTLIEHWTASSNSWAIFASPNSGNSSFNNSLSAVTCASASECWAIGYAGIGELIEHWTANSNSWAIVVSPDFNENTAAPKAVTCASASECWVVGYYYDGSAADPVYHAFIERWNGTSWAFVASPATDVLDGVTCASANDCWAVGPPIEHWDGTSWAVVPSPSASGLNGVTCASGAECWAVGSYAPGSYHRTLIEEFAPTIPPLTSVVSRMTHGGAGTFDITLPLTGTRGVECRSSTSLGAGNYTMVFSFVNNLTSCGTASTGSLSTGPGSNQCTVNLTGVANQQYITVTLNNVLDSQNNTGNVSATMGVLVGDVNASGVVTSGDTNLCKAQALQKVTNANFRNDINASGAITTGDANIIKQNALHQLPSPP